MIAARAGPRRMSWLRGRGGGWLGDRLQGRIPAPQIRGHRARIGSQPDDQPDAQGAEHGNEQERPRAPLEARRPRHGLGGDREQRARHGADRPGGRDRADTAAAQHRRIQVGGGGAAEQRRPLAAAEDGGADDEQREAPGPDREAAQERADAEQAQTGQDHRLASQVGGDAPDDEQRDHAEREREADAEAGQALVSGELLRGDGAHGRVERNRRAHEDLGARQAQCRARDLARDDDLGAHRRSMSHRIRQRAARARDTLHVS